MTIESLTPKPIPVPEGLEVPAPEKDKSQELLVKASRPAKPTRDIASLGKEGFGLL